MLLDGFNTELCSAILVKSLHGRLDTTEISAKRLLQILPNSLYTTNSVYSPCNYAKPKGV